MHAEQKPEPPDSIGIRPGNGDVYLLLVAINDYQHEKIQNLTGCIPDINKIETYIKRQLEIKPLGLSRMHPDDPISHFASYPIEKQGYGTLKVCRLVNNHATYQNLIRAFREFLRPATAADRIWFHFSGHGTEAQTAEVFETLENGYDQCLICYDFGEDEEGNFTNLLADKELAVLLKEVAKEKSESPHIVVTIDSCQSGGATREKAFLTAGIRVRNSDVANKKRRTLASYLNGYYGTDSHPNGNPPEVPWSPHIVLTACSNKEKAAEFSGGIFTQALVKALKRAHGRINYADLQRQTRSEIRKRSRNLQTPQFDIFGGVKAYERFLEGVPDGNPDTYEVLFQEGCWTVACGAIHGLPTEFQSQQLISAVAKPVELAIYHMGASLEIAPILTTSLKEIGPLFSTLDLGEGQLKPGAYYGILNYFPAPPKYVQVTGEESAVSDFITNTQSFQKVGAKNIHLLSKPKISQIPDLEVQIDAQGYQLTDLVTHKKLEEPYHFSDYKMVLNDLLQIVNWHRLIALENKNPSATLADKIQFEVEVEGREGAVSSTPISPTEIHIIASEKNCLIPQNEGERYYTLKPKIRIRDVQASYDEPLHMYLFSLWSWYEIYHEERNTVERSLEPGEFQEYPLINQERGRWGLYADEDEDTMYYKVLVTRGTLDYHQLVQEGLSSHRNESQVPFKDPRGFRDWAAITLKIQMKKEDR